MQKEKKSKKNSISKLHKILDNTSDKDLHPKDEKDFRSLRKRLKETSNGKKVYRKVISKDDSEKEIDSLKPRVTIHPREEKKIVEFPEIEEQKTVLEIEKPSTVPFLPVKEELKEDLYKDEDVFEVEKVEVSGPEFIKVKPKEIVKEEKVEIFEEKKALADEEITEWEPVDVVEKKEEEPKEEKELGEHYIKEEKPKEELEVTTDFCNQCGTKLKEKVNFCPECGSKTVIDYKESKDGESKPIGETESLPVFIPIEKVEEKEEQIKGEKEPPKLKEETAIIELPKTEEKETLEEPSVDRESKTEIFKDIKSINEETAVLLYDNGFTSLDALTLASLKDLTKIKGIKRKIAKKIQKEIQQKSEWEPVDFEGNGTEEFIDVKIEDETSSTIVKKEDKVTEGQIEGQDEIIERDVKIEVFKDMESIDNETAVLLYDNGFTTINSLKEATLKDLVNIKGIKRKIVIKIQKEIEKKIEESVKIKPIVMGETAEGEVTEEQIQEKDEVAEKKEELPSSVELSTKSSEWSPTTEEEQEKQETLEEPSVDRESKTEIFKDIKSINEETAVLLYDNGFTSLDALTLASLKDLTKIKGIKRKIAKKIQKEIQQKSEWEPVDFEGKKEDETKEGKNPNERPIEKIESKKDEAGEIDEKILSYEPVKVDEEKFDEEEVEDVPLLKEDDEEAFKDINSIDEKIAKLLKENGINSIDALKKITIKELTKIRGIKGKIAKQIKKEVGKLTEKTEGRAAEEVASEESFERGENPFIREDEWDSFDEDKISDSKMSEIKGFRHGDYTLFRKEIETKSGKKRIVQFFSKAEPEEGVAIELPDDYEVKENKKTGVPYLRKKK